MSYPNNILIEKYPNNWIEYVKHYEHENGGCYYKEKEQSTDFITGSFISLYPDGHLTFLWNGVESNWNKAWKEVKA